MANSYLTYNPLDNSYLSNAPKYLYNEGFNTFEGLGRIIADTELQQANAAQRQIESEDLAKAQKREKERQEVYEQRGKEATGKPLDKILEETSTSLAGIGDIIGAAEIAAKRKAIQPAQEKATQYKVVRGGDGVYAFDPSNPTAIIKTGIPLPPQKNTGEQKKFNSITFFDPTTGQTVPIDKNDAKAIEGAHQQGLLPYSPTLAPTILTTRAKRARQTKTESQDSGPGFWNEVDQFIQQRLAPSKAVPNAVPSAGPRPPKIIQR